MPVSAEWGVLVTKEWLLGTLDGQRFWWLVVMLTDFPMNRTLTKQVFAKGKFQMGYGPHRQSMRKQAGFKKVGAKCVDAVSKDCLGYSGPIFAHRWTDKNDSFLVMLPNSTNDCCSGSLLIGTCFHVYICHDNVSFGMREVAPGVVTYNSQLLIYHSPVNSESCCCNSCMR